MCIDKSKGLAFTVNGIDFYRGLYSKGSYIASFRGKEIYLSSPLCKTSKSCLKDIAKEKIWEITGVLLK
jgi:hypothetical protein